MLVIDASVTLAWCFEDEGGPDADAALDAVARDGALAPSIWPLDVANGLRSAERHGRLQRGDMSRLRAILIRLPIEVIPVRLGLVLGEVSDLARQLELTSYDAAYLELAASRGLPLATSDARLADASTRLGVPLIRASA